jgi:ADP-heptose:LPS heptosyltransferase
MQADPDLVEHWGHELKALDGFKIGIVWQGSKAHPGDRRRSIPLAQFAPLANVSGTRLVSLQYGQGTDQLHSPLPFPVLNLENKLGTMMESFANIAAIMKHLDLVICCDTAVGHLAGALGIPVWIAVTLVPDWRWLLDRADSPWYGSVRLFRQKTYGRWDEVFEQMADELRKVRG